MCVCNCVATACVFGWVCLQMFLAHLKYPWQEAVEWIWTKPNTPLRSLLPWDHHLCTVLRTSEGSFCLFFKIFFSPIWSWSRAITVHQRNTLKPLTTQSLSSRVWRWHLGAKTKCVLLWSDSSERLQTHEVSVHIRLPWSSGILSKASH